MRSPAASGATDRRIGRTSGPGITRRSRSALTACGRVARRSRMPQNWLPQSTTRDQGRLDGGSAVLEKARQYGLETSVIKEFSDGSQSIGVHLPQGQLDELMRTPRHPTLQQEHWTYHCGGWVTYLGKWEKPDFERQRRDALSSGSRSTSTSPTMPRCIGTGSVTTPPGPVFSCAPAVMCIRSIATSRETRPTPDGTFIHCRTTTCTTTDHKAARAQNAEAARVAVNESALLGITNPSGPARSNAPIARRSAPQSSRRTDAHSGRRRAPRRRPFRREHQRRSLP